MAELRGLGALRGGAFAAMPLAELGTHGFEQLTARALQQGWQEAFLTSRSYAAYMAEREAAGLG